MAALNEPIRCRNRCIIFIQQAEWFTWPHSRHLERVDSVVPAKRLFEQFLSLQPTGIAENLTLRAVRALLPSCS